MINHRIQSMIMFGIIFSFSDYIKRFFNYMNFPNISTNLELTSELVDNDKSQDKNVFNISSKNSQQKNSYDNIKICIDDVDINFSCESTSPIQKQYGRCYNCNIKISDQENSKADYFAFDRSIVSIVGCI